MTKMESRESEPAWQNENAVEHGKPTNRETLDDFCRRFDTWSAKKRFTRTKLALKRRKSFSSRKLPGSSTFYQDSNLQSIEEDGPATIPDQRAVYELCTENQFHFSKDNLLRLLNLVAEGDNKSEAVFNELVRDKTIQLFSMFRDFLFLDWTADRFVKIMKTEHSVEATSKAGSASDENRDKVGLPEVKVLRWMQVFLVDILSWCLAERTGSNIRSENNTLNPRINLLNCLNQLNKRLYDRVECLYLARALYLLVTDEESLGESDSLNNAHRWGVELSHAQNITVKFLERLIRTVNIVHTEEFGRLHFSSWAKRATQLLINTVVPHSPSHYNYRKVLIDLVNKDVWHSYDVVEVLQHILYKYDPTDYYLSHVLEYIKTYKIPCMQPIGKYRTFPDILEHAVATSDILASLVQESKTEKEKTLSEIVEEIKDSHCTKFAKVQDVENIVLAATTELKCYGYPQSPDTCQAIGFLEWAEDIRCYRHETLTNKLLIQSLVTLCCAVQQVKGYWPRIPQMISWCLLITTVDVNKGRLLQILPEEGKSCVIAMLATTLACIRGNVDIVTGSEFLATRDLSEWSDYYTLFNITSATNVSNNTDEQRLSCYRSEIVYGTVGVFASDILRQEFQLRDVRGTRGFDAVVVDEVDFLLLDQGVQFTYLSDSFAVLKHLQPVLAIVWNAVAQYKPVVTRDGQTFYTGPIRSVYDAVRDVISSNDSTLELFSSIVTDNVDFTRTTGDSDNLQTKHSPLETLKTILKNGTVETIVDFLLNVGKNAPYTFQPYTLSDDGLIVPAFVCDESREDLSAIPLLIVQTGTCMVLHTNEIFLKRMLVDNVRYHCSQKHTSTGKKLEIPQNLKGFIDKKLSAWVDNAFKALRLQEGKDYVIKEGCVVPTGYTSVGVVESNENWNDGLQQFLEIKHKLLINDLSLVTNYLSNISFFLRYESHVLGVTTTLGSDADQDFIQRRFGVDLCRIPTFLRRKLYECDGVICENDSKWINQICCQIKLVLTAQNNNGATGSGRAVLVICEDRDEASVIYQAIEERVTNQIRQDIRDVEAETCTASYSFVSGDVIVSTKLAGRGIDIKLTEQICESGGLYVLVTFLPINDRIEEHAFNCAGRKGEPGTCEIVLNTNHLPSDMGHLVDLCQMKRFRELKYTKNVKALEQYLKEWELRESLFSTYCKQIDNIYDTTVCNDDEKNIILESVHEYWAIWLQLNAAKIVGLEKEKLETDLNTSISSALKMASERCSPTRNVYHVMNYAKRRLSHQDFKAASEMYTRAIDMNEALVTIAHYNNVYCLINAKDNGYMANAIRELELVLQKIQMYRTEVLLFKELIELSWCDSRSSICPTGNTSLLNGSILGEHLVSGEEVHNCKTSDLNRSVQARLGILKALDENIVTSLSNLKQLHEDGCGADTVKSPISDLVQEKDTIMNKEVNDLCQNGLEFTFSVKKKVPYSWEGFTVACLGAIQITAGIVVLSVTMGAFLNIGITLIAEGVSDMIDGLMGTYRGEFNRSSWAFNKMISLAISMVAFSFAKVITKGLRPALSCLNASWKEVKLLSSVVFKGAQISGGNVIVAGTVKKGMEHATKYAVKESLEQCVRRGVNYMEDKLIEEFMDHIEMALHEQIRSCLRDTFEDSPLRKQVDRLIIHTFNEGESEASDQARVLECLSKVANEVVEPFVSDLTVKAYISQGVRGVVARVKLEMKRTNNNKYLSVFNCMEKVHMTCDVLDATYKLTILSRNYSQFLTEGLEKLCYQLDIEEYDEHNQNNVPNIHEPVIDILSDILSVTVKTVFHQQVASHAIIKLKGSVNGVIHGYVRDTLQTAETMEKISEFASQRFNSHTPTNNRHDTTNTCLVNNYITYKMNNDSPEYLNDCWILSESLGKAIEVYGATDDGLTLDMVIGENSADDDSIKLLYHSPSVDYPEGRYDAVIDGEPVPISTDNNACAYHAVARALYPYENDTLIKLRAEELKVNVISELTRSPGKCVDFLTNAAWANRLENEHKNIQMDEVVKQASGIRY